MTLHPRAQAQGGSGPSLKRLRRRRRRWRLKFCSWINEESYPLGMRQSISRPPSKPGHPRILGKHKSSDARSMGGGGGGYKKRSVFQLARVVLPPLQGEGWGEDGVDIAELPGSHTIASTTILTPALSLKERGHNAAACSADGVTRVCCHGASCAVSRAPSRDSSRSRACRAPACPWPARFRASPCCASSTSRWG